MQENKGALTVVESREKQTVRSTALPADQAATSDAWLIAAIVNGDIDLFEALMRRYNNRLFRVARSLCADDQEAMDVVQDSWIRIYRALPQFRGPDGFPSWASKITYNSALMSLRKQRRIDYVADLEDSGDRTDSAADNRQEPLQQLAQSQLREFLEQAIDRLPLTYRAVFVLRAVQNLNTRETAASLDLSEDAVKQRFSRARRLLQSELDCAIHRAGLSLYEFDGARCDHIVQRVMSELRR